MKGQTRGGTRERAPRLEHRVPGARSFSTSSMEHGASSLALVSNLSLILINLLRKISIKIETVFGFSQGTENGSSREISKIEGGEGIIAVVNELDEATPCKDAPIGLDEVGMTVMVPSAHLLHTGSRWKWGVETEKMLARLASAQCQH
ncbi:hypothetical protein LB506_009647 [Fusarium annulatum]|nr:hypothetical protein LB506_009647 [Fusarium annulatum]